MIMDRCVFSIVFCFLFILGSASGADGMRGRNMQVEEISVVTTTTTHSDETSSSFLHTLEYYQNMTNNTVEVNEGDLVYDSWGAPLVCETHKLIFFNIAKVASSQWKMLFRRMLGYDDWLTACPHNPKTNGLIQLSHYPLDQATDMMNSPEWTRAVFLRDPKERFLSAYLDKVHGEMVDIPTVEWLQKHCPEAFEVFKVSNRNLSDFFSFVQDCPDNVHWQPQIKTTDEKCWGKIDFFGHLENADVDAKALLEGIGAWEEYGATGWGDNGDQAFFGKHAAKEEHRTGSSEKMAQYYTPELEEAVEQYYAVDYEFFGFEKQKIVYPP